MDAEEIGKVADLIDGLLWGLRLPASAERHLEGVRASLPALRDRLRAQYVAATGSNPWKEQQ